MNKKLLFSLMIALVVGMLVIPMLDAAPASAADLADAIASAPQGTGAGQIDPKAEPGYLGIPGGPKVNMLYGLLWAIWVGWIFSTVGAFGGIMAGVGHITIFGLADYAKSF